jgi:hypothetical protein
MAKRDRTGAQSEYVKNRIAEFAKSKTLINSNVPFPACTGTKSPVGAIRGPRIAAAAVRSTLRRE